MFGDGFSDYFPVNDSRLFASQGTGSKTLVICMTVKQTLLVEQLLTLSSSTKNKHRKVFRYPSISATDNNQDDSGGDLNESTSKEFLFAREMAIGGFKNCNDGDAILVGTTSLSTGLVLPQVSRVIFLHGFYSKLADISANNYFTFYLLSELSMRQFNIDKSIVFVQN